MSWVDYGSDQFLSEAEILGERAVLDQLADQQKIERLTAKLRDLG